MGYIAGVCLLEKVSKIFSEGPSLSNSSHASVAGLYLMSTPKPLPGQETLMAGLV